jgi:hypothetical protein
MIGLVCLPSTDNVSLTLRVVKYLHGKPQLPIRFVTVIHLLDGWVVRIKVNSSLNSQQDGDLQAFLNELGISYEQPPMRVIMALESLSAGQSPIDVMCSYQVAVVSHGSPQREEVEAFRQQFIKGLGYCPQTLI